jgi:hypothetical protein
MKSSYFKKIIFLFLFLTSTNLIASTDVGKIKESLLETNFLTINLTEYPFNAENRSVVIASNQNGSKFFAANSDGNEITQIDFIDENNLFSKRSRVLHAMKKFLVPKLGNETIHISDMHVSANQLYVSVVKMRNEMQCTHQEIFLFDDDYNAKLIFSSSPCIKGKNLWWDFDGRLASNDQFIFVAGGNMFLDIFENSFPNPAITCCIKNKSYKNLLKATNYFGWIISIDKKNYKTTKISTGHRRIAGLYFEPNSRKLFETEHGPRGGDEINIIEYGKNYGWPFVSYGRAYESNKKNSNSINAKYNSHQFYEEPFYVFMPSIGISEINSIGAASPFSSYWLDNLIVSSLKDHSLYRIKTKNNKVIYQERILIGSRIRNIQSTNALIILSTDDGKIITLEPGEKFPQGVFPSLK